MTLVVYVRVSTHRQAQSQSTEQQLERLVKALRADDGGREAPPEPRL